MRITGFFLSQVIRLFLVDCVHVSLISHLTDFNGRPSGEAYVQFTNVGDGKKALTKNKENMGHRWVGIGLLSNDHRSLSSSPPRVSGSRSSKGFRPVTEGSGGSGRGGRELENILPLVTSLLVLT